MASYLVAFCYFSGGEFVPFESAPIEAADDAEAKVRANEWAHKNYALVDDRTWLHVKEDARGVYSRQLGKS